MSEINDALAEDMKLFNANESTREIDRYDELELSENDGASRGRGSGVASDDGDDEEGLEHSNSDANDGDDDNNNNDGSNAASSSEANDNGKRSLEDEEDENEESGEGKASRKKKRKVLAVKRAVDGDNISCCFIPVGTVDKDSLCLLGITLCCVRQLSEQVFLSTLESKNLVDLANNEAEKQFQKKYDFFEDQLELTAPRPLHFCQQSRAEHLLYSLKGNWKEVAQQTINTLIGVAGKARRCFVYCVAKFRNEEELRAHSSPFIAYPMLGHLTWHSPFSVNWQTATEWPNDYLDMINCSVNAAVVTEAKLARCVVDSVPGHVCSANQPLALNALFQFNFDKLCAFGSNGGAQPVRYCLKFNNGHRTSPHPNFCNGRLVIKTSTASWTFWRTNFLCNREVKIPHEHGRTRANEKTTMPTVCEEQFAKDAQVASVMTRKQVSELINKKKKALMRFGIDKKNMSFDDVVQHIRETSPNSKRFHELVSWMLPATAPPHFWQICGFVGFDKTVKMVLAGILEAFRKYTSSKCPQIVLDSPRFAQYQLLDCLKFCDYVAVNTNTSADDVKLYGHVSNRIRSCIEDFPTEQRCISRPDVTDGARSLCWPNDANSTVAAIRVTLPDESTTTFVSRKNIMQQDVLVGGAIAYGFGKKVRLCRSDCRHELRLLLEDRIVDGSHCAVVVSTASDKVYWDQKAKYASRLRVFVLGDDIRSCVAELKAQLTPLDDVDDKWNIAFPRADFVSYEKLATILTFVTTTNELNSPAPTNKLSFLLMKPAANAELELVKQEYRKGCCSLGGTLIIGGLAFQVAERENRCGNVLEDLYFSGLFDASLLEKYVVVQKIKDSARDFLISNERVVNEVDKNKFALSTKFISFTKHVDDRFSCIDYDVFDKLNAATERKRVLTLHANTFAGTMNQMVARKIDFSKSDVLPHLSSHEDVVGCVAVVFDCVDDNTFFKINNASKNLAVFSYDYSHIDKQPTTPTVDKIVDLYTKVKTYVRAGFSLAAMISLQQSDPQSIVVFGSMAKSINARVSCSCQLPWFYMPPSKGQAGRPWYHNSDAIELSSLCWILKEFYEK